MRSRVGSLAVVRKMSEVTSEAVTPALSTPSFASSSSDPLKARFEISSETVKPMPAIVPPPASAAQPIGGRSRPRLSRVTSQAPPRTPIGFPTT